MSTKTNGQVAYEAYGEHTQWKSLANGKPIPQWADVKPEIKEAWEVVGVRLSAAPVEVAPASPVAVDLEAYRAEFKKGVQLVCGGLLLPDDASPACVEGARTAALLSEVFTAGVPELKQVNAALEANVAELQSQQEILARVVNALGLKQVDGVVDYAAELKRRAAGAPRFERLTYRRTGSLIELRTAETGEGHKRVMEQVTDLLELCGITAF